jgi:predicted RNase H-like HicB family nuclease
MQFTVVLEQGESGYIIASCPALPGCHSQGRTEEEALDNIKEAIVACLLTVNERARRQAKKKRDQKLVEVFV